MKEKLLDTKRIIFALLLFSLVAMTLTLYEQNKIDVEKIFHFIEDKSYLGGAVFISLLAIAGVIAFPIVVFMLGGGLLFGPLKGFIIVSIGLLLSAALSFILSRYLFHDYFQKKYANLRLLQWTKKENQDNLFVLGILARIFPLFPFSVLNYGWALTRVRLKTFVGSTAIGNIPGTFVYVYLGSTLIDIKSVQFFVALILFGVFVVSAYMLKNKVRFGKISEKINKRKSKSN